MSQVDSQGVVPSDSPYALDPQLAATTPYFNALDAPIASASPPPPTVFSPAPPAQEEAPTRTLATRSKSRPRNKSAALSKPPAPKKNARKRKEQPDEASASSAIALAVCSATQKEETEERLYWTDAMVAAFVESLMESLSLSWRSESGWNEAAWKAAEAHVKEAIEPPLKLLLTVDKLKSKLDTLKAEWRIWCKAVDQSGWSIDPDTGCPSNDRAVMETYCQSHPKARKYVLGSKNRPPKPLAHADELTTIFADVDATGNGVLSLEDAEAAALNEGSSDGAEVEDGEPGEVGQMAESIRSQATEEENPLDLMPLASPGPSPGPSASDTEASRNSISTSIAMRRKAVENIARDRKKKQRQSGPDKVSATGDRMAKAIEVQNEILLEDPPIRKACKMLWSEHFEGLDLPTKLRAGKVLTTESNAELFNSAPKEVQVMLLEQWALEGV